MGTVTGVVVPYFGIDDTNVAGTTVLGPPYPPGNVIPSALDEPPVFVIFALVFAYG